jgi:hypothetical protein
VSPYRSSLWRPFNDDNNLGKKEEEEETCLFFSLKFNGLNMLQRSSSVFQFFGACFISVGFFFFVRPIPAAPIRPSNENRKQKSVCRKAIGIFIWSRRAD